MEKDKRENIFVLYRKNVEIAEIIGGKKMGLSLRIEGKEIYPLVEIAKIEGIETTEMMRAILNEGTEKEVIRMYSIGEISLWKAAGILGISSWEMIDRLKEKDISVQVGRMKGEGGK